MVQSRVTLGWGNLCRKSLYLIELLPKPAGQSVTLLSGRLNHAQTSNPPLPQTGHANRVSSFGVVCVSRPLSEAFGEREIRMGADAFHVCYGLRWEVDAGNEEEVTLLEERQDARQKAARKHKLDSWWGFTSNQGRYFVLVGKLVGSFGWENEQVAHLADTALARLTEETRQKLQEAGFEGEPAWHYQFEPNY